MTITVMVRSSAKSKDRPAHSSQATSVSAPAVMAMMVSHSAARLARSWPRERDCCASSTMLMTCDR